MPNHICLEIQYVFNVTANFRNEDRTEGCLTVCAYKSDFKVDHHSLSPR